MMRQKRLAAGCCGLTNRSQRGGERVITVARYSAANRRRARTRGGDATVTPGNNGGPGSFSAGAPPPGGAGSRARERAPAGRANRSAARPPFVVPRSSAANGRSAVRNAAANWSAAAAASRAVFAAVRPSRGRGPVGGHPGDRRPAATRATGHGARRARPRTESAAPADRKRGTAGGPMGASVTRGPPVAGPSASYQCRLGERVAYPSRGNVER